MIVEALTLVNAHSRNCGHRTVQFDPDRIATVIDVYYMLHPDTRLLYDAAYEVRFQPEYPQVSYVVVGPKGIINHLKDRYARLQKQTPLG